MSKPTIDDVRAVLHAGHSKGRRDPEDTLNQLWIKHFENRAERYGEEFVRDAPRHLTDDNTLVTLEDWSTDDLSKLIRQDRTRPLQGHETAPVVIVEFRSRYCVISNGKIFTLWARLRFLDKRIQWGRYRFDLPMAPRKVLNRMVLGKGLFQRVTVAEGLNLMDIASLMEREGLDNRERFLKEAGDPELLSLFGLQEMGVEGYLFPDTYHFSPSTSGRDILVAMIKQFEERFTPVMEEQAKRIGLDRHQVVTLASLIEKETGGRPACLLAVPQPEIPLSYIVAPFLPDSPGAWWRPAKTGPDELGVCPTEKTRK